MARIAHDENADVIFTPYQVGSRVKGPKQVLMIRNMEPYLAHRYQYGLKSRLRNVALARLSSQALRTADRVVAVSKFAAHHLTDGLDIALKRIRIIHHGRDGAFSPVDDQDEDLARLQALGIDGEFLLTCGSVLPYRRYEDVIAAFNSCADSIGSGTMLVIAGSGSDDRYARSIQRAVSNSPYANRILAVGHVSRASMISLYRRCLACIIATEIEACPNIAIEAMASGCPILSSDRPPLPEMFAGSSLTFESRNTGHMAQMIQAIGNSDSLRATLRRKAIERADHFSWERCAQETFAALTEWPAE